MVVVRRPMVEARELDSRELMELKEARELDSRDSRELRGLDGVNKIYKRNDEKIIYIVNLFYN